MPAPLLCFMMRSAPCHCLRRLTLAAMMLSSMPVMVTGEVISLERAGSIALETDQSIGIAALELDKAALEPARALTRMAPTLTLGAREFQPSGSSSGSGGGTSGGAGNAPASVTFEQPLFDLSVVPAYKRGKLVTRSARHEYRGIMREVLFGVASAYYDVLRQQSVVIVSRETSTLAKETLDLAQKRVRAGEVTRTDELRAAAQWQESRRQLIDAEGTLDVLRNRLANILNLPTDRPMELATPSDKRAPRQGLGELVATAWQHRDDLLAEQLVVEQDVLRRKEIQATYAPKASVQVSAFAKSSSTSSTNGERESWQAVFALQWPLIDAGQRQLELKTAQYEIGQSRLRLALLRKDVQHQVQEAWVNVRVLSESLEALEAQVAAAAQGHQDLQKQYSAGAATNLEVLDALRELNRARQDHTVQRYALQVALHKLERVTGVYQEPRISQILPP